MACLLGALVTAAPQGHGDSIVLPNPRGCAGEVLVQEMGIGLQPQPDCVGVYATTLLAEVLKLTAFPED